MASVTTLIGGPFGGAGADYSGKVTAPVPATVFRDRKVKWLWKPERKWPLLRFSMLALLLLL